MACDEVKTRLENGVLEVMFDRPQRKNALTLAMYDAICDAFDAAAKDPATRVVMLRGNGGTFTSGNDLQDFASNPPTGTDTPIFRFLQGLWEMEKPLVAAVEGHAVGVGTTMLLHCDLVYAADTSKFQLPFVNLALVPEAGSGLMLPARVGHTKAAELFFFGEPFDGPTAKQLGLVNEVLPASEYLARARERAQKLAQQPPSAVRQTKMLMKRVNKEALQQQMLAEGALFIERLGSPEVAEAITAFFEKRKPDFSQFS